MQIDSIIRMNKLSECRRIFELYKKNSKQYKRYKSEVFLSMVSFAVSYLYDSGLISAKSFEILHIESFSEDDKFYLVDFAGSYNHKFNKYDGFDQICTNLLYNFKTN